MSEPAGQAANRPPARPAKPFGLPRAGRVLTRRDFRRIYTQGTRARGALLTAVGRRRKDELLRLGLSVSTEHGAAVRRNKIKRILREAFRLERPTLPPGFDVVLIPTPSKRKLRLVEVRAELKRLLRELETKRQKPRPR